MTGRLRRDLGLAGAVGLGLGSIIGTGIFVSVAVAAAAAGSGVLLAVALAAVVAGFNASSSAQLAAVYPVSGGTYEYGYEVLGPTLGFMAGWTFLAAKSASAATAALGFAGYLLLLTGGRAGLVVPIALVAVVVLTAAVLAGIRRSYQVNLVIVAVTVAGLGAFVAAGAGTAAANPDRLVPFGPHGGGIAGLLEATALMFVAYTGYGRIATLGEEVRDPQRTIPRAVALTLLISVSLYLAVTAVALGSGGPQGFASAVEARAAPLEILAGDIAGMSVSSLVSVAAMTAMLGVLLNLILGLSRVALAMGRRGDLPRAFGDVWESRGTPWVAVLGVAAVVGALVFLGDVAVTWSFSAFTVLVYYAITNLSALRLSDEERRYPRWAAGAGLAACLSLAFWVEARVWAAGLGLIVVGLAWHFWRRPR